MGFLAGFAVKVPLFPVHTWLPLAHTEAPTAGSVILAGVLLKLGTYGLLRLAVPIGMVAAGGRTAFPNVSFWIAVFCVVGVIYGALVAWVQQDIKKLVAYSSVSHLGFCVLGLVALNDIGIQGSVMYMINHGISTGAMFLVIGMIYDRYHTRDIDELSGLAKRMPVMAFFFVFFVLSSIGFAGDERLRQRVFDDPRRVHQRQPRQPVERAVVRRVRGVGDHPGRGLHAAHDRPA